MSRQGRSFDHGPWPARLLGMLALTLAPHASSWAQAPAARPGAVVSTPAPPATPALAETPGVAEIGPAETAPAPLPADIQIVRFQGPEGLKVEVLAPTPEPAPPGDGQGISTVGLKRGVGYRLRLSNLPFRPGVELFPVVELVGHLHRPADVDPAKYPIRVVFNQEDLDDVADGSRLVTKVVYLEDPDSAIPFRVAKDQVSSLTLNPAEEPLRVASALGRPMVIVRMGGRQPSAQDLSGEPPRDLSLDLANRFGSTPCPFLYKDGSPCSLPCGPLCTSAPVSKPTLPRDEYLCDGGDRGIPASPIANGQIGGVDPRDAVVRFDIGLNKQSQPRVLPTNVVCVYAPRFAEVRIASGTIASVNVESTKTNKYMQHFEKLAAQVPPRKLVQNQSPELARERSRASALRSQEVLGEQSNNKALAAYAAGQNIAIDEQQQKPENARTRQKANTHRVRARLQAIKTGESPVLTGIVESASEAVKVWGPHDMTGVETPPNLPGLAVIKRASVTEAQPGDTVTYVIIYRNMGNTPIKSVRIVDSLLPRLEYKKGTARGPEGTQFSSLQNTVGSTELRWALPGPLAPGQQGYVSFEAIVR